MMNERHRCLGKLQAKTKTNPNHVVEKGRAFHTKRNKKDVGIIHRDSREKKKKKSHPGVTKTASGRRREELAKKRKEALRY